MKKNTQDIMEILSTTFLVIAVFVLFYGYTHKVSPEWVTFGGVVLILAQSLRFFITTSTPQDKLRAGLIIAAALAIII